MCSNTNEAPLYKQQQLSTETICPSSLLPPPSLQNCTEDSCSAGDSGRRTRGTISCSCRFPPPTEEPHAGVCEVHLQGMYIRHSSGGEGSKSVSCLLFLALVCLLFQEVCLDSCPQLAVVSQGFTQVINTFAPTVNMHKNLICVPPTWLPAKYVCTICNSTPISIEVLQQLAVCTVRTSKLAYT